MADEYSLKWNKHQKTVVNCLSALRQTCSFVDVTLHTSDGHTFSAHKVVLSACSSFFEGIFKVHPTDKIAVFLKDISHMDLRFIMEFVYSGEISVSRSSLPSLLDAAEALGIKGLCRSPDEYEQPMNIVEKTAIDPSPKKKRFKLDQKIEASLIDEIPTNLLSVSPCVMEGSVRTETPSVKSEFPDGAIGVPEDNEAVSQKGAGSDGSEESMHADAGELSLEVYENEGLEDSANGCRVANHVSLCSPTSDNIDLGIMEENLGKAIVRWCDARLNFLTSAFREGDNFYIETFVNNGKIGGRFICLKCNPISVIKVTGVDDVANCGRKMKWDKRNICRHIISKHYRKGLKI